MSMEREHLRHLFKDELSQIILIIMLISSSIINELGQILANFCKKYSLFDICVYTGISKSFSTHEYKI